jgi:hypothetical protein
LGHPTNLVGKFNEQREASLDNKKPQKRVWRSSPATKEYGVQLRSRIEEWEKDPDGKPKDY